MTTPERTRLLRVDLSAQTARSEAVPERWRRRYVGGKGLAARYLYEAVDPGTDPLSPGNALLFALGPLSGLTPGQGRYAVVTKSPLTGVFLDSYSGGTFADRLAGTLPDHLAVLIEGAADAPRTVVIGEEGEVTFQPADDLWGRDVVETCEALSDGGVACIGPAGERGVRYATIASDAGDHHAGRGGAGAVLGAKRLKAVVARGDPPEPPAALDGLRERYERRFEESETGTWQATSGTLETVDFANEVGVLPTRGWREGTFEGADGIGIEAVRDSASEREAPDDAVPGDFRVPGEDADTVVRGGTPIALGSGLGIGDFDAVATLGERCDRLGLDVISAGNAVAWAVLAAEEGLIERDLAFGDPEAARDLLGEIASRDTDLGDALADGVDAAGARFGGEGLVPTVKAMEVPSYDPRGSLGMALAYATSDRGACHRRARPVTTEAFGPGSADGRQRAAAVIEEQDVRSLLWSLIVDDVVADVFEDDLGAEWLSAVGLEYDVEELRLAGERIWTLTRLFNVREGLTGTDDSLASVFTEPLGDGPHAGSAVDPGAFEELLHAYYALRDWGEDGVPSASLLDRVGLSGIVDAETPVASEPATLPESVADGP